MDLQYDTDCIPPAKYFLCYNTVNSGGLQYNLFITNTMLLIGYSLDDNDFRSIWQIINSRLGGMAQPAYCITVGASPEKIAKYKRRNIKVINLEGEPQEYKIILHDLFVELKDYIDSEKDKTAKSIDERINEQMIIPAENNKLCFISCAMSRIAQLSALINPVPHNLGITPVRIDDMLMPGDNWIDISRTAIRKSKAVIIDISDSSSNVTFELGLIKSTKQKKNILILCEEGTSIPVSLIDHPILTYTFDIANEKTTNHFAEALREWSCRVFDNESNIYDNKEKHTAFVDAYRLFEKTSIRLGLSLLIQNWSTRFLYAIPIHGRRIMALPIRFLGLVNI